ncbi:unnamed protein product [Calypogeia fissa]
MMQRCLLTRPGTEMEAAAISRGKMRGLGHAEGLVKPSKGVIHSQMRMGRRGSDTFSDDAFRGRAAILQSRAVLKWENSSVQRRDGGVARLVIEKKVGFGTGALNVSAVRGSGGRNGAGSWKIRAAQANSTSGNENPILQKAAETLHLAVSLGAFLALDRFLKQRFVEAGIRFPSALFGMFCIFILLNVANAVKSEVATMIISFFQPAITFIQRWLPLFYVPSLVVVPLAIQGIPTAAAAKIALIIVAGWAASCAVAGSTAMVVRSIVKTEMEPAEYTPKAAPFADWEVKAMASAMVLSFALAIYSPTALGTAAMTVLPFFLSATALGYAIGSNLPAGIKKIFHPIITCAITADVAAFVFGYVSKTGFEGALKLYLTKQAGNPGAGDVFMGVLGSVILSFAFSMFYQRKLVKRHAPEIFSAVAAAGVFSLYSTALAGRFLGLPSGLTLAIVPRCITVALALPIAGLLEAGNPSLTAAVVVLTGLIGANFTQVVMDKLAFSDPISRGLATACSAHGLGTAALSAKEPEALPFCAIAYALTGIFCSVLVTLPVIQRSLILVAGAGAL